MKVKYVNTPGIYKIQSKIKPERCYIGSAVNIRKRWTVHQANLKSNSHHSPKLQRHYNKYGRSDLLFSVITCCVIPELLEKEQFFIDAYNPWFNMNQTAASFLGRKHSEETKQKIREINLGKKHSDETKKKLSELHKGNKYNLGRKLSEEHCRKIGENSRGRKMPERSKEYRAKLSAGHMGQKAWNKGKTGIYSEEALKKMRDSKIGNKYGLNYKHTAEAIHKMSEKGKERIGKLNNHYGKKHTDAAKDKIRKARLMRKTKSIA